MVIPVLNVATVSRWCGALALLCVLPLSAGSAASTIYRWEDAQGRVHFGDATSAPSQAKAVPRQIGAEVPEGRAASTPPAELPVTDLQDAPVETPCSQARAQYDAYLNAVEIFETDRLGVERPVDPGRREQLLARAEMEVSRACDDAAGAP